MKLVRCHSKTCKGAQRFGVPVDPDIPYLSAKSGSCSQLLQTEARLSTVDLRPFLTQTKDTDIVVESWCIWCKERTRTSRGRNKYVDIFPRWTGGAGNLLYVEREPTCLFCKEKYGQSGRFIPISESIRSTYPKRLRNFVTLFSRYNITLQRLLLEQLLPSSKEPKSAPRCWWSIPSTVECIVYENHSWVVVSNYAPNRFCRTQDRRGSDSGVRSDAGRMRVVYESNKLPNDIDWSLREWNSFHQRWHFTAKAKCSPIPS